MACGQTQAADTQVIRGDTHKAMSMRKPIDDFCSNKKSGRHKSRNRVGETGALLDKVWAEGYDEGYEEGFARCYRKFVRNQLSDSDREEPTADEMSNFEAKEAPLTKQVEVADAMANLQAKEALLTEQVEVADDMAKLQAIEALRTMNDEVEPEPEWVSTANAREWLKKEIARCVILEEEVEFEQHNVRLERDHRIKLEGELEFERDHSMRLQEWLEQEGKRCRDLEIELEQEKNQRSKMEGRLEQERKYSQEEQARRIKFEGDAENYRYLYNKSRGVRWRSGLAALLE